MLEKDKVANNHKSYSCVYVSYCSWIFV